MGAVFMLGLCLHAAAAPAPLRPDAEGNDGIIICNPIGPSNKAMREKWVGSYWLWGGGVGTPVGRSKNIYTSSWYRVSLHATLTLQGLSQKR